MKRGGWAGALVALCVLAATANAADRRALLIGVQDYGARGAGWENLQGPGNDMDLVRTVLRDRFGFPDANIRVLRGAETTRTAITAGFEQLIRDTRPGDAVYIHYSGHGATVKDANGDEAGRRPDAALVPRDGGPGGAYYILDDEIAVWLHRLLARTEDVVLVIDACHSGTITRSASSLRIRRAPVEDPRSYDWSDTLTAALRDIDASSEGPRFVRLSACLDTQAAWEYRAEDEKIYGRFTWFWCRALLVASPGQTFGEVFRAAQALTQSVPSGRQEPRLEGAADRVLFQGNFREHGTQVAVLGIEDGRLMLSGGVLSGITPGSVFQRVWSAESGDGALRIKILEVGAVESTGEILSGTTARAGDLLEEVEHMPRLAPLLLSVDASGAPEWKERVERDLARVGGARLVGAGQVPDLLVRLTREGSGARCEILDGTEGPFGAGRYETARLRVLLGDERDVALLADRVEGLVHREELLGIAGVYEDAVPLLTVDLAQLVPARGDVPPEELVVLDVPDAPAELARSHARTVPREPGRAEWAALRTDDVVTFRLRNRTLGSWYLVVFNLKPNGEMERIFPDPGREDEGKVKPRETVTFGKAAMRLSDPGQVDTYLCFASEKPGALADLEFRILPAEGEPYPTTRGMGDRTSSLLEDWVEGLRGSGLRGGASPGGQLAVRRFSVRVEK